MPRKPPSRIIVITGASNGPGRAVALECALHGYGLVLGSRREGPLETVRRDCEALGALTLARCTDLSDPDEAHALAEAAMRRFKRIDVWINYAPPTPLGRGDNTPVDAFQPGASFDLRGYQNGATAALAAFAKQGRGVLVNVDSLVGGAPPGCEHEYAEARRAVAEAFASIEARAADTPDVTVTSVQPSRVPMASETLAPMIVSMARAQSRRGLPGRVLGALERGRFRVWSRTVPPHRRGAHPEVISSTRRSGAASQDEERLPTMREGSTGGTAVLATSTAGKSTRDAGGHRHGSWHLAHTAGSTREHLSTAAVILGLPLVILAAALLAVT